MASRPNMTRQTTFTNTQQNQNQIRTRSQLALPEFNVEYDRSPLKHARDAMRRANARFSQEARAGTMSGSGSGKGEVDSKMADVLARAGISSGTEAQRFSEERENEIQDNIGKDEDMARTKPIESNEQERPSIPRGPFDFSSCASDTHPKYPKRPRSSSFDETALPSPSGFGYKAGDKPVPGSPLAAPRRGSVDIGSTDNPMATSSASLLAPSESTPTASGVSGAKRAKTQGTLDSFFKRSSGLSSSSLSMNTSQAKSTDVPSSPGRRFFSETPSSFESSHRSGTASTPLQDKESTHIGEPTLFPKTPTVKQLRAIPMLDLRTVTPSPRKHTLNLGLGASTTKPALKARAVSAGAALVLGKPGCTGEGQGSGNNGRSDVEKRATSEPHESVENEQHLPKQNPQPSAVPLPPSPPELEDEAKKPSMDIDSGIDSSDTSVQEGPATAPKSPRAPPCITVSTSTSTEMLIPSSTDITTKQRSPPSPVPRDENRNAVPLPTTPRHKILPSRPLPSGHLPSTKSHLSKLLSLSPLTPLSAMESKKQGSDEYDYKEEQQTFEEEERRQAKVKDKVNLTDQRDGESKSSDLPTPVSLSSGSAPKTPGPSSSSIRKQGSKSKHKGKLLSSTSRGATGATSIKKRKSLVSVSGTTPRMRLTRASVLRQKAIQAQMRTPKADKSRPSLFKTKDTSIMEGGDKGDTKQDDKTVQAGTDITVQDGGERKEVKRDKHTEPQTQRSPRKTFVLTVPSSLSPRKSSSAASSANSSLTLKSMPKLDSGPSKPFTFSLYPPPINDTAANEQAKQALNKLSSALDKLAMPPPSRPNSSAGANALRRPASEQRERIRPATSLGFTREMSVPVSGPGSRSIGRPRSTSRAGSVDSTPGAKKSFLPPPPPPTFGSSLSKDKGKAKAYANSSRTAPVAFGPRSTTPDASGNNKMPPPSSFRFGFGGTTGVFGRPIPRIRASQNPSLETVQGSPVKGGLQSYALAEEDEEIAEEQRDKANDGDVSATSSNANGDTSMSSADGNEIVIGKELKRISKLNASRRASMAFTALSQSLMTSPDALDHSAARRNNGRTTPVDDRSSAEPSADDKRGTLTSSTSRPQRAAAPRSFTSGYPSLGRTQSESSVRGHSRSPSVTSSVFSESDSESTLRSGSKSGRSMGRTKMPGSLDVLAQCTIFVDVRTDEGDDAGALFVDMSRGLGAKVLTRVGQTCTHIVYKNGLASTLTKYRLLDEPRPHVVGIGWVVECAEKRARVDETRFKVDIENINVAGALKRRRSFLPKQVNSSLVAGPMDAFLNGAGTEPTSVPAASANSVPKACADSDSPSEDGDTSQERTERATLHSSLSSSIHPLERARRRSVMISR